MQPATEAATLPDWWAEYKDEVEQAQAFSTADLPDEPAEMGKDMSRANREVARMGFLLTEAEQFLLRAHAAAVLEARRLHPELTADERKAVAKADADYLLALRMRDTLQVIVSSLKDKAYSLMNMRRTTFVPHAQE